MDRPVNQSAFPWESLSHVSEDTLILQLKDATGEDSIRRLALVIDRMKKGSPNWLIDVAAGFGKLMVHYRPEVIKSDQLYQELARFFLFDLRDPGIASSQTVVELPVCYDPRVAPDIESVASQLGLSIDEVSKLHYQETYTVLAVGFALGFAYMGHLNPQLNVPRKATPSTRVPAGSVAIAGTQTTIYPTETPGGWSLIGMCPKTLVEKGSTIKLTLPIGTQAKFQPISYATFKDLEPSYS